MSRITALRQLGCYQRGFVRLTALGAALVVATGGALALGEASPLVANSNAAQGAYVLAQAGGGQTSGGSQKRPSSRQEPQAAAQSGDAGLRQRVEQLEEQLVDIQVVLGTLQSLAQGQRAAPAPSFGGRGAPGASFGGDASRIDVLETQIRALTLQIERMQNDVRAMGGRRSEAPVEPYQAPGTAAPAIRGSTFASGFGTTHVTPASRDPIGGLLLGTPGSGSAGAAGAGSTAAMPASLPNNQSPKDAYETAYGYLLQQNYGAAETAFTEFVERHPQDALAGNAQYWLGETYFVRGDYKSAASAFLKGYQAYGLSGKAPESLLKLAISLDRLGQKDSACSTLGELTTRFPTAAQHVLAKADTERRRAGC